MIKVNNINDQSEFEANACSRCQARENACERGTVGFASHWLRKWSECWQPITERSKAKTKQTRNYFGDSIETRSVKEEWSRLQITRTFKGN